jgi:hypothetical protein
VRGAQRADRRTHINAGSVDAEALAQLRDVLPQGRECGDVDVNEYVVPAGGTAGRAHQVPTAVFDGPVGNEVGHSVTAITGQVNVDHPEV